MQEKATALKSWREGLRLFPNFDNSINKLLPAENFSSSETWAVAQFKLAKLIGETKYGLPGGSLFDFALKRNKKLTRADIANWSNQPTTGLDELVDAGPKYDAWKQNSGPLAEYYNKILDELADNMPELGDEGVEALFLDDGMLDLINSMITDPTLSNMRNFLSRYDKTMPSASLWDMHLGNFGYTIRNGKKYPVIIDPGFALD